MNRWPNCLFCMEPVGPDDLDIALLPCMCRLDHHNDCRAHWNKINPYKCPLCRKKFEIERTATMPVQPYNGNGNIYIPIPSAPTVSAQQPRQPFCCTPAVAAVSVLGIMFAILLIIYIKFMSS